MIGILHNAPPLESLGITLDLGVLLTYALVLILTVLLLRYFAESL